MNRNLLGNLHQINGRFTLLAALFFCVLGANGQVPDITTDTNGNGVIDEDEKKLYLIQTNAFQSFYMVPDNSKVTTNNILDDYMLWYFLDAGKDNPGTQNEIQYYYIINNSTGKCIYNEGGESNDNRKVSLANLADLSDDNKEKCKFKLVLDESNNTPGFYNIDVKGRTDFFGLNKQGGSQTNDNPIRLTNNQYIHDINSKWKFVPYTSPFVWPDPPFTISNDVVKKYYKIHNIQNNTYYVSTDETPDKVTYASTVSNCMVWYFEQAPTDPSTPWFKYYYIFNPKSGKYMYYSGTATNGNDQTNAVCVKSYDSGNEDRYQFVVVQAARGDGNNRVECYAIIPKLLTGILWGSNSLGPKTISDGANMGIITSRKANSTAHWEFKLVENYVEAPVISFDNETGYVTMSCNTPGANIHYTIGQDPEDPTTGSTQYTAPFQPGNSCTIKAIGAKGGNVSEVTTFELEKVATPNISIEGLRVTMTCTTPNARIHYEMGDNSSIPTPTFSSPIYSMPLTVDAGTYIKAIAEFDGMITSDMVVVGPITPQCATPVIRRGLDDTFTIECSYPTENYTIYYTTDNDITVEQLAANPTLGTSYTDPVDIADYPVTVKAITVADNFENSEVAVQTIDDHLVPIGDWYEIASAADFLLFVDLANTAAGAGYNYRVIDDFTVSSLDAITQSFTGTFDGGFHIINTNGVNHALFNIVNGGTVKNVVLDNVGISGSGNVGAICNEADGATKIYNCGVLSGTVTGTDNVGGLVGLVRSSSSVRVVNCYNYANVSGGTYAAGIVGKNEGTVSDDGTVGNVRIALCMMYGNVTGATNISPVYGGNHVDNKKKYTEYNYWRYRSGMQYNAYNDQMAVEKDDYLTRFPFYLHILNTHHEMAAYFLFGGVTCDDMSEITQDNIAEMGHWVLKKDVADYPIIEPWPKNTQTTPTSANNNLPSTTNDYEGKLLTNMGTGGYLSVSVIIGANTYLVSLPITDMDTLNYDFTWGKVVLPFANEFEVNTDYSKVCTGWKITGITGGTAGSFENYNVSDRKCTTKDLYETIGFIFAQGGNYIVPYNVTGIEITANFATAYYLCDESYDIAYEKDSNIVPPQTNGNKPSGYMTRTTLAGSTPNSFTVGENVYTIYHTLAAALDDMSASGTTHAQAIVLLGNYHLDDFDLTISGRTSKGYTIMSIDADNNQEPDYAIYSNNTMDRPAIPPTRYDFVAFIPLGMSSHINGARFYPNTPIWKPRGWFEITETGLMWANQFEIESSNFNTSDSDVRNYRCIINGGYFTQMVRSRRNTCRKLSYYQIGGKAYIKEFYPGNHSQNNHANTLVPVNVTGGEIEQCFMTGYGQGTAYGPDIYFWCAGGRIHKFLGAYMEKPRQATNNDGNVNLTAKIDHARIYRFFGGGTTSKARVTGNIKVTIDNSFIDFYCGGPEFGDMEANKTVTTTATNTTFREYYGAGFGGTATTYTNDEDDNKDINNTVVNYTSGFFERHYLDPAANAGRLDYKPNYGIGNCYKFEYIMQSRGHQVVARFYTGYAMFSLAKTGSITNTLTNCIVERSFYGGGCQGTVDGTVNSTLTDCTILQSAFGGGYKAESNVVGVYPETPVSPLSSYYSLMGVFSDFGEFPTPDPYTWTQGTAEHNNEADPTNHKLYTSTNVTMTDLGNVTGAITLTLDGHTVVTDNVFGGGNESKSLNNATVIIKGTSEVGGNVFGGGNKAFVGINTTGTPGNTTVKLQGSARVIGDVFGGGNQGEVGGNSSVIFEQETPSSNPGGSLPGNGTE